MSHRWHTPSDLGHALDLLHDDEDAVLIAGGVSMVLFMNVGFLQPADMVSLAGLRELFGVRRTDGGIDLGAMETHTRLATDTILRATYPAAADMFSGIANVRVRNWGTLGGNLAHADPAQDPPVMLTVLGASAEVVGSDGSRSVPVGELAAGPLTPNITDEEIITRIRIPVPSDDPLRTAYVKFLPGTKDDYATVSIAAALRCGDDGRLTDVRLAGGSVGPTVVDLASAAQCLEGQKPDPDVLASVAEAVREQVHPRSDRRGSADYKREMAGLMTQRAVRACLEGRPDGIPVSQGVGA
jgi:aerobic carbon-monoxide dehydrogenase medium subunit